MTTYIKKILATLIAMSIPTILEQLLSTLLQYVDTAMVGQLGEQATAAISVTTTITWLINSISSALSIAAVTLIAQALGEGNNNKVKTIAHLLERFVLIVGLTLTAISIILAPFIPAWMGAETAIRRQATIYFIIISIPLVFRTASSVFGAAIRGTQNTKTPMIINFSSNIINVILNLVLIYGLRLGVTGAAIGSAIAYTIGGIFMYRAFRRRILLGIGAIDKDYISPALREILTLSFPVLGTNVVSCLGYVVFAGMVSGMGTTIFAAHSIAVTAETIFYIPGYGLRSATSAMVGLAYGERDEKKLKTVSTLSVAITIIMMLISGTLLYIIAYPLMTLFTSSTQVALIGSRMLRIVAFTEPFFGLMVVLEGILYGLGRTRYAFFVESGSMWGIRILFTYLCVHHWHLGLTEVWYCMIADNICKAILLSLPFTTAHPLPKE